MKIYMLVNNNYLCLGLSVLLKEKCESQCIVLGHDKTNMFFLNYTPEIKDVFVVSMDLFAQDFNYLLNIRDAGVPIIILNESRNSPLASVFGVLSIPYRFSVETVLNCIKKHNPFSNLQSTSIPRLTARERNVLYNITKGQDTRTIGDSMGISEKTVYSHLAIIMRKIGLKNRVSIALLPSVYINYLCAGNQSRVVY